MLKKPRRFLVTIIAFQRNGPCISVQLAEPLAQGNLQAHIPFVIITEYIIGISGQIQRGEWSERHFKCRNILDEKVFPVGGPYFQILLLKVCRQLKDPVCFIFPEARVGPGKLVHEFCDGYRITGLCTVEKNIGIISR